MKEYLKFLSILRNSKEYSFEGTILTVRSYRTGEEIKLDLAELTKEEFENILITEE
jgi:hypothetical protein